MLHIAALLLVAQSGGQPTASQAWPHLASDIPSDARIRFSVLTNGLRVAWMDNPEPKDRCYLRLHVDVGSLHEEDNERGMAHFLEHMAFNGSRHHPAGTLVTWFQKHGMAFGADTNAHTGYSETVYKIDLPATDAGALREGLQVLRDFADGLTLAEDEIAAEKGVVDAEERERDSAHLRAFEATIRVQFAGTRVPERSIIGSKSVRDAFDSKSVRAFYERWYRPDNMTLIVVGDLRGRDPLPLVRELFADVARPAASCPPEPDIGRPESPPFYAIHEKDLPVASIGMQMTKPWQPERPTRAEMVRQVPLACARAMLNLRLSELAKEKEVRFLSAHAWDSRHAMAAVGLRVQQGEGLSIQCKPENWQGALAAGEAELRRALQHGFATTELAEVKQNLLRDLAEAVERERTRDSAAWLAEILHCAEHGTVPSSAATAREIQQAALSALDVDACRDALRAAWSGGEMVVGLTGPVSLGDAAANTLREVYEEIHAVAVAARPDSELAPFAYASDPAKAAVPASRTHDEEFDVHTVMFANGVRLVLKKTAFKKKEIRLCVAFGAGELGLGDGGHALGMAMPVVLHGSGLEAHTADELRRLSAGREVLSYLHVQPDQFEIRCHPTSADLVFACEIVCARLLHPGWRDEGLRQFRQSLEPHYESMRRDHGGIVQLEFLPELYAHDHRHGLPPRAALEAIELDDVRARLEPHLRQAPLAVFMVGDLDVAAAVAAVARTFGMLPARAAPEPLEPAPAEMVTGLRKRYEIETKDRKSLVWIAFPTTDGRDLASKRGLRYLAQIVSDRLRRQVREKLGATYSPGAFAVGSDAIPGDGYLAIQALADPADADRLVEIVLGMAGELAESGPTQEEVDRLRQPQLNRLRDAERTNDYWHDRLVRMHARPDVFTALRTERSWWTSVKAEDLAPLAKRYLPKERASIAIVAPKTARDAPPKEAAAPDEKKR